MAGRVQVAISADGTEIVGRVRGQGPPMVLVHGGWGDGEVAYEALVPHLADRFTCYTPSTRGRGLSGDNPDHSCTAWYRMSSRSSTPVNRCTWWAGRALSRRSERPRRAVPCPPWPSLRATSRSWRKKTTSPALVQPSNALVRQRPTGASPTRLALRALRPYRRGDCRLGRGVFRAMGTQHPGHAPVLPAEPVQGGVPATTLSSLRRSRHRWSPCGAGRPPRAHGSRNRLCTWPNTLTDTCVN